MSPLLLWMWFNGAVLSHSWFFSHFFSVMYLFLMDLYWVCMCISWINEAILIFIPFEEQMDPDWYGHDVIFMWCPADDVFLCLFVLLWLLGKPYHKVKYRWHLSCGVLPLVTSLFNSFVKLCPIKTTLQKSSIKKTTLSLRTTLNTHKVHLLVELKRSTTLISNMITCMLWLNI